MAERFRCSEAWVRSEVRELEAAGYIQRQRRSRGVRYLLKWLIPTESGPPRKPPIGSRVPVENGAANTSHRNNTSGVAKTSQRNNTSGVTGTILPVTSGVSLYEPDQEPEHRSSERQRSHGCWRCWRSTQVPSPGSATLQTGLSLSPASTPPGGTLRRSRSRYGRRTCVAAGVRARPNRGDGFRLS